MKVIVLGAGLVGGPMAVDLANDKAFEVTVADINQKSLNALSGRAGIRTMVRDLKSAHQVMDLVKGFDLVLSAVPGHMGFQTLNAVIDAGKDVIDIAFFPEDLFLLDDLAKKRNVTAISDIGVAPGMSNILIGYANHLLDQITSAKIYVGGLPKERNWPWEYKAVFSPIDVIEEYTRPARYVENSHLVIKPALTDPELLDFPKIGTLEAFNSDGLRSLIHTIEAPDMIEKTLRYPGHIDKIKVLKETGFFDDKAIEMNGNMITPLEFTSRLLFPKWKLEQGEVDITVMKVIVEGAKNDEIHRYTWDLYDEYDPDTGVHSMARTTGYTATMAVRMLARGLYTAKGVSAPEYVGRHPECVKFILDGLKKRKVIYNKQVEKL